MEALTASERASVAARHYRHLAPRYDEFLQWSPDFIAVHADKMVECLALAPGDQLVDLACGTGMYSLALLERVTLRQPIIGVDPSRDMLDRIPEDAPVTPVHAHAESFSRRDETYDKVFLKEAIHHIDDQEELFENLHGQLRSGGVLLLVHVTPDRVAYPLFDAALQRCRWWFSDPEELAEGLDAVGFEVEHDHLIYHHAVPRDRYLEMVEGRYMSLLTSFEDEDLEAGINQMRSRYADVPVLEFTETFDYLVATRT